MPCDVASEIVGGVQKLLNTATSTLIYEFHITGSVHQPQIFPVPAPVLSPLAAALAAHIGGAVLTSIERLAARVLAETLERNAAEWEKAKVRYGYDYDREDTTVVNVKPGKVYPPDVTPYGGVCIQQGPVLPPVTPPVCVPNTVPLPPTVEAPIVPPPLPLPKG